MFQALFSKFLILSLLIFCIACGTENNQKSTQSQGSLGPSEEAKKKTEPEEVKKVAEAEEVRKKTGPGEVKKVAGAEEVKKKTGPEEVKKVADAEEAKKKTEADAKKETNLDKALTKYKEHIILGGPEALLRQRFAEIDDFAKKYEIFSEKMLDKTHTLSRQIGIILHYDANKFEGENVEKFTTARNAFKKFIELVLSGAPAQDIETEKKNAGVHLVKGPDQAAFLNAFTDISLASLGIKNFDAARENTIMALKAMNERLKKDHDLQKPNELTEAITMLEALVLKGDTVVNLKAGLNDLTKTNEFLQQIVKKFD